MSYVIGALAFIFILGAAVVIHEFGHFLLAKLQGIRVETFSVGFGPRILGWRWGTTDYRLSVLPLGGYVKLGGDESNASIEGASAVDIPHQERFDLRPRWQKFLVIIAGPVMNMLTAFTILFVGALLFGVPVAPSPVVGRVVANGAAERAGLQRGDHIVAFNGKENPTWERMRNDALLSPDQPLPMVIERSGQRMPLTISPSRRAEGDDVIGMLDFQPDFGSQPVKVSEVIAGSPAAEAGLQPNDRVLAINDEPVQDEQHVVNAIQAGKAAPIRLSIERNGEQREITASVRRTPEGRDQLGFGAVTEEPLEPAGPFTAAIYAVRRNVEFVRLTFSAIGKVFNGERSARDTLAGPIGIARASSTAANSFGWGGVFSMLGILSLNLGVMNLLPIPVLDGGAILLLFVEAVLGFAGLTLSMAMRERIQQAGFVIVLLLMVFVISNDVLKEASRWRGSSTETASPPAASTPPAAPAASPQQR